MKKFKNLFLLVLCCLMLCQTTVDGITTNDGIETYGHYSEQTKD